MKMIRTPHFKKYVEDMFVWAGKTTASWTEQQAKDKFNETMYEDFNSLHWIMDSIFPKSRRNGDDYEFITNDIQHSLLDGSRKPTRTEDVGAMTIKFIQAQPRIFFSSKFIHGHLAGEGRIGCWGGYQHFDANLILNGFSAALMDMYSFGIVSAHSTFPGDVE